MNVSDVNEGDVPVPEKLPFVEPRLHRDDSWTLENVTANLGGFMSGPGGDEKSSRLRQPVPLPLR